MNIQVAYEDVKVDMEIPPLTLETSTRLSVRWAAASGDDDPIHYDQNYAKGQKLPNIIINGRLKIALLSQLITNWMGPQGFLKKLEASLRGMDIVNDPITCKGLVKRKYVENARHLVEIEMWIENKEGKVTAPGSAIVILP